MVSHANSDTWIASAISEKRLFALKNGTLELRDAYTKPEIGHVIEFVVDRSGNLIRHFFKAPEQLMEAELPESGILIRSDSRLTNAVNAVFAARSLNSNVVLLHIYPTRKSSEAPAKAVGHILSSFQDYISTKIKRALATSSHVIRGREEPGFNVNILGTFAGSFGVEMAIRGDDSRIGSVLREAVEELGTADELDTFRQRMETVDDIEVKAMSRFMRDLAVAETDLKLEAASPEDVEPYYASASLPKLREAVKTLRRAPVLRTETRTVVGELIGLNLRTRRFELNAVQTEETLVGGMAAEIFTDLKRAEIPSTYRVVIEASVRQGQYGRERIGSWKNR